ncbi:hypothetical protein JOB18_006009 [Solea senegalensis]|uniref:Uncharacterized protein n=1 Tax=Solea senegalensis TaxID=28829 RepID=A0AAV6QGK2_SOLSE|nr:hypothetical protein JOB18_006009 [Solea senegalensis]
MRTVQGRSTVRSTQQLQPCAAIVAVARLAVKCYHLAQVFIRLSHNPSGQVSRSRIKSPGSRVASGQSQQPQRSASSPPSNMVKEHMIKEALYTCEGGRGRKLEKEMERWIGR